MLYMCDHHSLSALPCPKGCHGPTSGPEVRAPSSLFSTYETDENGNSCEVGYDIYEQAARCIKVTGNTVSFGAQTDKLTPQVMVSTLRQAETSITNARALVLEMRRLLLQHAPIADAEVIAALALSYELVGD